MVILKLIGTFFVILDWKSLYIKTGKLDLNDIRGNNNSSLLSGIQRRAAIRAPAMLDNN